MAVIKFKKEYLSLIILLLCLSALFRYPIAVKNGVINGIEICLYTIVPSLFPFMTLSTYIVKSDILSPFYKFFSYPIKVLLRQPASAVSVIFMSMIGGFPIGIKMTNDLYTSEKITIEQAQRLCLFCMNGGPAFTITAVGLNMLNSTKAGAIIYTSLCISSLISGVISSIVADKNDVITYEKREVPLPLSSLSVAVSDSLQAILNISSWVILFSSVISCIGVLNLNEKTYIIITSLIEVTKGCAILSGKFSLYVISGIIGFGGFCVHFQVMPYLKKTGLKYIYFFISRILNGLLSAIITQLLLVFFPVQIEVFSNFDKAPTSFSFSSSVPAFFVVLFMCIIMILDIDRKKKIC